MARSKIVSHCWPRVPAGIWLFLLPPALGRPLVVAVGVGRGQDRAEPAVVERVGLGGRVDVGQFALVEVGQRELVGVGALRQEASVELGPARVPAVPGVGVAAALVLRSPRAERLEVPRRDLLSLRVREVLVLDAVGLVREPAEVVVERAVLHAEHHEVVDLDVARARQPVAPGLAASAASLSSTTGRQRRHPREPRRVGGPLQEVAAAERGVVHGAQRISSTAARRRAARSRRIAFTVASGCWKMQGRAGLEHGQPVPLRQLREEGHVLGVRGPRRLVGEVHRRRPSTARSRPRAGPAARRRSKSGLDSQSKLRPMLRA